MTLYQQCPSCERTYAANDCMPVYLTIGEQPKLCCPSCLHPTNFAFSVDESTQTDRLGFCDGCDELEAELHLMDGDWLCDTCKAQTMGAIHDPRTETVIHGSSHRPIKDVPRESIAIDTRHYAEEDLQRIEQGESGGWEEVKGWAFVIIILALVFYKIVDWIWS